MEGNLVRREWWRYYEDLPEMQDWLMSVDATFKDGDNNDFVAIQVWGKRNADMYLIDAVKKHLDMPSTMREILRLRGMYPKCLVTLIEDKANGSAIIKYLRTEIGGIIAVNPDGGKVARVNAISGAIESGNVLLPMNKRFTPDFVDDFAAFPNGKHDDQVDCCSQALNRFIYHWARVPEKAKINPLEKFFPALRQDKKHSATGYGDEIYVI
jgi:predicted phage terminase large subunit-like protein